MTAFRKTLCGIMAFVLTFALVFAAPISVFAEEEPTTISAAEIELNKETTDEGLEYIKVEGDSSIEIVGYSGSETEVNIPSRISSLSVISIGKDAFAGNDKIETVSLHSDITSLGEGAFRNCTALKEVKKTKSLSSIGAGCFEGCTSMETFKIPDNVTEIPEKCFLGCTALAEVDVHKNLKSVAKDAFGGTAWENNMPDGPLSLGRILYSYKGAVKDVVIPDGVSIIEDGAFIGCDSIETLTLGYDVEEIGLYAFQNCVNLKTVNVNDALGVVESGAFKGCISLTAMDFSESTLAAIGYEAFSDCIALSEVKLCETISDIGDYAFQGTALKSISFDKNMASIGVNTFLNIKSFEGFEVSDKNKEFSAIDGVLFNKKANKLIFFPQAKLTDDKYDIPESVNEIGDKAFYGSTVSVLAFAENNNLERIGVSAFENSQIAKLDLVTSKISKIEPATFKNAAKLQKVSLPDTLTYIGAEAFSGCAALAEIKIPDSVKEIANAAFKNAALKSVNTGNGVAKINAEAFSGNKALTDLYLGNNVEKLGDKAFAGCTALVAVNLPESMKAFNGNAFEGCTALAKVTVAGNNKNLKAVGDAIYSADGKTLVFVGNKNLTSLAIANDTEVIAEGAFTIAKNASAITFPATLRYINGNALDATAWYGAQNGVVYAGPVLYKVNGLVANVTVKDGTKAIAANAVNNPAVKSFSIPRTVEVIGENAFAKSGLVLITVPDSVNYIGAGAFRDAAALATVNLSTAGKIEKIEAATFKGCSALASIVIPASVKVISADAFAGCAKLAKVDLGAVEEIEQYAFADCTALSEITLPATVQAVDAVSFYGCTALKAINVAEGNEKFQSLDGVVLVANGDEEPVFDTIAIFPAGKEGDYVVPETVINIADKAFYNCDAVTDVVFHTAFINIGAEAFYDCDNITAIELFENARDVGSYSFASCDNLREFIVHSNLTDYEDNAFDGCFYFSFDSVPPVENGGGSAGTFVIIVIAVVAIGVIAFVIYNKKQKKIQAEIIEKNKIKEALAEKTAKEDTTSAE